MKRFGSAATIALALVASLALVRSAVAGDRVPLNGSFEGTSTRTPLDPPFVQDVITASGEASHLGRFDMVATAVVNLPTRSAIGTYEFVAANGDTLTATFTGVSEPTATPGVILITETATITGGTGRFAGASGTFVIERLFTPATGETTGSIQGTISSPGSNGK
jgi:hypothetical protein